MQLSRHLQCRQTSSKSSIPMKFTETEVGYFCSNSFSGVKNFRPLVPGTILPLYRSAALDNVTSADVDIVLSRIKTIIDLRNADEILRGYDSWRFKGAFDLYAAFVVAISAEDSLSSVKSAFDVAIDERNRKIFQLPVFGKIQPFWEIVKKDMLDRSSMSNYEKLISEGRWLFNPQELSGMLVRFLEAEGLPLLYISMLENSMPQFRDALFLCLAICEQAIEGNPIAPSLGLNDDDDSRPVTLPATATASKLHDSDDTEVSADSLSRFQNGLLLHCAQGMTIINECLQKYYVRQSSSAL